MDRFISARLGRDGVSMVVLLTPDDVATAGHAAIRRHVACLFGRHEQRFKINQLNRWQIEVDGMLGELAVAKLLNCYWVGDTVYGKQKDDVACYQVRYSNVSDGCLPVHEDDKDDRPYILVTGCNPMVVQDGCLRLDVRGWLWGHEAKQFPLTDPRQTGDYAHFVQQGHLRPMVELPTTEDVWVGA